MKFFALLLVMLMCSVSMGQAPVDGQLQDLKPIIDTGVEWYVPSTNPKDCCDRLAEIEHLRNQYDLLDARIDAETDTFKRLMSTPPPVSEGTARLILISMSRLMEYNYDLKRISDRIIFQSQMWMMFCEPYVYDAP
jgi:hypothetical protein